MVRLETSIPYDFFSSPSYRYMRANIDVRYNRYGIGLCICALYIVQTQWSYTFPVKNVLLAKIVFTLTYILLLTESFMANVLKNRYYYNSIHIMYFFTKPSCFKLHFGFTTFTLKYIQIDFI